MALFIESSITTTKYVLMLCKLLTRKRSEENQGVETVLSAPFPALKEEEQFTGYRTNSLPFVFLSAMHACERSFRQTRGYKGKS